MRRFAQSSLLLLGSLAPIHAQDFSAKDIVPTSRPADKLLDQQTQEDLLELEAALSDGDVITAKLARERLAGRIPEADRALYDRVLKLAQRLLEQMRQQDTKTGKGYLWVRKPAMTGARWASAMSNGAQILRQQGRSKSTAGVMVLRIRLELPEAEQTVGVNSGDLHIWKGGGYGGHDLTGDGEFVLLGKAYQSGAHAGTIEIETLRHVCPALEIEVPEGKVVAGELLIRALPKDRLGSVHVRVLPEPGVTLDGAVLHVGRQYAPWKGGKPLDSDGTCSIEDLGAGSCEVYVEKPELLCSPRTKVEIKAGSRVDVELHAYARRRVLIDWKYRRPAGEGSWKDGSTTVLTGSHAPLDTWEQNGSAYGLSEWQEKPAQIRSVNGHLLPAEAEDFDSPRVRATPEHFSDGGSGSYPIAVGKVFAMRYGWPERGGYGEAVMRIRSIESVVALDGKPGS